MHVNEAFVTSSEKPESLIWANGTTDKRFDIAGNKFFDTSSSGSHTKISALNPIYMTNDVKYIFKYV